MTSSRLALMLIESARSFARLRAPSAEDRGHIQKHVLENIDLVPDAERRAIAAIFAPLETTPTEIAHFFCLCEEAIAAPFIARSPALDDRILFDLIGEHGAGPRTRAIARRRDLSGPVRAALRELDDAAIDRALELRQTATTTGSTAGPAPTRGRQALDGEALRQIAALAGTQSRPLFETALADATGLSMTSARILCDDPTSRNFLFALRFMGLHTSQALAIFFGLAPELDGKADVEARFEASYEAITAEAAAGRVRRWQLEEIETMALGRAALPGDAPKPNADTNAA